MPLREVEIVNKLGLHARASAKLTQLAAKYQSDVALSRNNRKVNAKSIMGVMMLAAGKGAKVTLEINGPDEAEAMEAIVALINDYFGEGQGTGHQDGFSLGDPRPRRPALRAFARSAAASPRRLRPTPARRAQTPP